MIAARGVSQNVSVDRDYTSLVFLDDKHKLTELYKGIDSAMLVGQVFKRGLKGVETREPDPSRAEIVCIAVSNRRLSAHLSGLRRVELTLAIAIDIGPRKSVCESPALQIPVAETRLIVNLNGFAVDIALFLRFGYQRDKRLCVFGVLLQVYWHPSPPYVPSAHADSRSLVYDPSISRSADIEYQASFLIAPDICISTCFRPNNLDDAPFAPVRQRPAEVVALSVDRSPVESCRFRVVAQLQERPSQEQGGLSTPAV